MAKNTRKLVFQVIGDATSGSAALAGLGDQAGRTGGKFATFAKVGAAGLAAVGAAGIAAVAGLAKVGAEFDAAYDKIRVGTGATGDELAALQDNFRTVVASVPADFEGAGQAIAAVNTRLGLTGPQLETVSGQLLELSRITDTDLNTNVETATRVMGDWGIAADEQSAALDRLFQVSQATGPSVDKLGAMMVQYGAPVRQLGFSFDEAAMLLGQFEQQGVNTELVMGSMRQMLGKVARDGEPAIETFARVSEEIKSAGSTSEANAKAIELFGARAGPDMAAALREGRFDLEALGATLEGTGDTILGVAEETRSLPEQLTLMKNQLFVALEPIAGIVFGALGDLVQQLAPVLESLVTAVGPVLEQLGGTLGPIFEQVGAALAPVLESLAGRMAPLLPVIADLVVTLADAFAPVLPMLAELAGVIAEAVVPVVGALVEALAPVIAQILDALQPVLDALSPVLTIIGQAFADIVLALAPLLEVLPELMLALTPLLPPLAELIGALVEGILPILTPIIEGFAELAALLVGALAEGLAFLIEPIADVIGWLADLISKPEEMRAAFGRGLERIGQLLGDLVGWIAELPGRMGEVARNLFTFLPNQFIDALNMLIGLWNGFQLGPWTLPSQWTPLGEIGGQEIGPWSTPDLPTIPRLASGAVLREPTIAMLAEQASAQPEIVTPEALMRRIVRDETAGGGAGVTIVVKGNLYGDERAFGRAVAEALNRYGRSGGRVR